MSAVPADLGRPAGQQGRQGVLWCRTGPEVTEPFGGLRRIQLARRRLALQGVVPGTRGQFAAAGLAQVRGGGRRLTDRARDQVEAVRPAVGGFDGNEPLLVAALRRREEAAFVALVKRYHSLMLRVAYAQLNDVAASEDGPDAGHGP